jgi:molybdopterin/thiamine biosynthesis adenylyltransferase/rhodanese-related sulfurtransferase
MTNLMIVLASKHPTGRQGWELFGRRVGYMRPNSIPDLIGRLFTMATFRDLLSAAKSEITEVDTEGAAAAIADGAIVLDVREPDEYEEGALLGAIHIPRGHLEAQIEGRIIDKQAPVVAYCAGGVRSAFAAKTLAELGYTNVLSMEGGYGRWKDEGREWKAPVSLTPEQNNRYKRHLLLPEVGTAGQVKLLDAKVLMLGAGGLGSPSAMYLAAAGVGTIGIVDMDDVDASNLQRQILHNIDRIGDRKVDSAKKTLTMLNPDVNVVTYDTRLDASNIMEILEGYDVVVDGADNFPSRYLLNDASVKLGIPVVHGSIFRFEGMVSVFHPTKGPTYRDMVPEPPPAELAPSCAEAGVLGVLPGIIGSIQALETIKVILDLGEPLIGRILTVDTSDMEFRVFNLKPNPENEVTYENRDRIQIKELDGLCAPGLS